MGKFQAFLRECLTFLLKCELSHYLTALLKIFIFLDSKSTDTTFIKSSPS